MANTDTDVRLGAQGHRPMVEKTSETEQRVHARFRSIKGRSLAEELIRERRAEAQRESAP